MSASHICHRLIVNNSCIRGIRIFYCYGCRKPREWCPRGSCCINEECCEFIVYLCHNYSVVRLSTQSWNIHSNVLFLQSISRVLCSIKTSCSFTLKNCIRKSSAIGSGIVIHSSNCSFVILFPGVIKLNMVHYCTGSSNCPYSLNSYLYKFSRVYIYWIIKSCNTSARLRN